MGLGEKASARRYFGRETVKGYQSHSVATFLSVLQIKKYRLYEAFFQFIVSGITKMPPRCGF